MLQVWLGLMAGGVGLLLLGGGLVGWSWAGRGQRQAGRSARWAARLGRGLEFVVAMLFGLALFGLALNGLALNGLMFWGYPSNLTGSAGMPTPSLIGFGWTLLSYDGAALLMSSLVGFLGWMVVRYSKQYLAGDPRQAAYWGWLATALGAGQWLIAAGNLLVLVLAWTLASLALHQLLLYHSDRPLARRAAATKFTLSRLADVALYSSAALLCWKSGSLEFEQLRQWVLQPSASASPWLSVACLLLVVGAMIRSAQLPFHFWLPQTLDTPTPVSALMHAGIVNAGGFVMVRLSFLLIESPLALNLLAIAGLLTALLGGLVMLTQPSVKSALAWSTVAQMGFMMFQCGLGAFSAALLHIVAHSLYKSHAFLSSGSVLVEQAGIDVWPESRQSLSRPAAAAIWLLAGAMVVAVSLLCGVNLWSKSGGVMLGGVLASGAAHWLLNLALASQGAWYRSASWWRGVGLTWLLCAGYFIAWRAIDSLVQPPAAELWGLSQPLFGLTLFSLIFTWLIWNHGEWVSDTGSGSLETWRIHAAQGFYLESMMRRGFGGIAPSLQR